MHKYSEITKGSLSTRSVPLCAATLAPADNTKYIFFYRASSLFLLLSFIHKFHLEFIEKKNSSREYFVKFSRIKKYTHRHATQDEEDEEKMQEIFFSVEESKIVDLIFFCGEYFFLFRLLF